MIIDLGDSILTKDISKYFYYDKNSRTNLINKK